MIRLLGLFPVPVVLTVLPSTRYMSESLHAPLLAFSGFRLGEHVMLAARWLLESELVPRSTQPMQKRDLLPSSVHM